MNNSVFDSLARRLRIPAGKMAITPLAGDASSRRFFRLSLPPETGPDTAILILFPPGHTQEADLYSRMSESLRQAEVPVPELLQKDIQQGYLLTEDCGDRLLQEIANNKRIARNGETEVLYRQAIDLLILMQKNLRPEKAPDCPALRIGFDESTFLRELNFFLIHTVEGYYNKKISVADREDFRKLFLAICREALTQPRTFCHRDYHSRNLLVRDGRIRIIDFQDARMGPYTYDLVSLLHDPYVNLPHTAKEALAAYYQHNRLRMRDEIWGENFPRDCAIMSIQRILKAAGTYGYMYVKKGKRGYVGYLPTALRNARDILRHYSEFSKLRTLLEKYVR